MFLCVQVYISTKRIVYLRVTKTVEESNCFRMAAFLLCNDTSILKWRLNRVCLEAWGEEGLVLKSLNGCRLSRD